MAGGNLPVQGLGVPQSPSPRLTGAEDEGVQGARGSCPARRSTELVLKDEEGLAVQRAGSDPAPKGALSGRVQRACTQRAGERAEGARGPGRFCTGTEPGELSSRAAASGCGLGPARGRQERRATATLKRHTRAAASHGALALREKRRGRLAEDSQTTSGSGRGGWQGPARQAGRFLASEVVCL